MQGDDIRAFIAAEHRRGLAPKSLQRRLSACRSLYRWLLKHGDVAASPAEAIRDTQGATTSCRSVARCRRSRAAGRGRHRRAARLRDRALLELFYSSGLRLSEPCAARADLDFEQVLVTVLVKGSKRASSLSDACTCGVVQAWREESEALRSPVFPVVAASRSPRARWQLRRASWRCARRVQAGASTPAAPQFRSHMLESSGDLRGVQNCWASRYRHHPTIPIWISSIWPRSTTRRIRGEAEVLTHRVCGAGRRIASPLPRVVQDPVAARNIHVALDAMRQPAPARRSACL